MSARPTPEVLWHSLHVSAKVTDRNVATLVAWGALLPEQGKAALARYYEGASARTRALHTAIARAHGLGLSSSKVDLRLTPLGGEVAYAGVRELYKAEAADLKRAALMDAWSRLIDEPMVLRVLRHAEDPAGWMPDSLAEDYLSELASAGWIHTLGRSHRRRVFLTNRGKDLRRAGEIFDLHMLTNAAGILRAALPGAPKTTQAAPTGESKPQDARRKREREALTSLVRSGNDLAGLVTGDAFRGYVIDWERALDDCNLLGLLP